MFTVKVNEPLSNPLEYLPKVDKNCKDWYPQSFKWEILVNRTGFSS